VVHIRNGIDQNESFYFGDIRIQQASKKYDIIYLSNIGDYLSKEEVKRLIAHFRENMLTENGIVICTSITNDPKFDGTDGVNRESVYNSSMIEDYNVAHKEKLPFELLNHSVYTVNATPIKRKL